MGLKKSAWIWNGERALSKPSCRRWRLAGCVRPATRRFEDAHARRHETGNLNSPLQRLIEVMNFRNSSASSLTFELLKTNQPMALM